MGNCRLYIHRCHLSSFEIPVSAMMVRAVAFPSRSACGADDASLAAHLPRCSLLSLARHEHQCCHVQAVWPLIFLLIYTYFLWQAYRQLQTCPWQVSSFLAACT